MAAGKRVVESLEVFFKRDWLVCLRELVENLISNTNLDTVPSKNPKFHLFSLWSSLCPRALLEIIEQ